MTLLIECVSANLTNITNDLKLNLSSEVILERSLLTAVHTRIVINSFPFVFHFTGQKHYLFYI